MYQSPAALDYTASYVQDEALRHAAQRRLEHEVDQHTSVEHRVIVAAVMVLLLIAMMIAL